MRRIRREELPMLSSFMVEQFYVKEELQQMFHGFEPERAKEIARKIVYFDLLYLFENGDIFICDDSVTGAIVGLEAKRLFTLKRVLLSLKANQIFKQLSKGEVKQIKENSKVIQEVHSGKWFKQYCKNPYYLAQFAIEERHRGQGIARKMLEQLFDLAKQKHSHMVLETLTPSNVPLYQHFGFELKDQYTTKNQNMTEFRMLKRFD